MAGTFESSRASVTSAMKSICVSNSTVCTTLPDKNAFVQYGT